MLKVLLTLAITSIPMLAQSVFNGTWRLNTSDAQVNVTEKFLLKDGRYSCSACDPPIKDLIADGRSHKALGSPYYDAVSVRVIDDNTVEVVSTRNSRMVELSKLTVSQDNQTATRDETFTTQNGQQNHERDLWKRTADGPPGAHKISGTWKPQKIEAASDSITLITYKVAGSALAMHDGQGDSFDAKLDGKDYPYKGDPGTTSVSLKKIDANTIEETDKRNGRVIAIWRMTVGPDGKSMKIAIQDKIHASTLSFTATRQ